MMSPRMANDIAVAMRAMQLAVNSRCLFMTWDVPLLGGIMPAAQTTKWSDRQAGWTIDCG